MKLLLYVGNDKKESLLSGIAQISPPFPPSPHFGQLGPPFLDVKRVFSEIVPYCHDYVLEVSISLKIY